MQESGSGWARRRRKRKGTRLCATARALLRRRNIHPIQLSVALLTEENRLNFDLSSVTGKSANKLLDLDANIQVNFKTYLEIKQNAL